MATLGHLPLSQTLVHPPPRDEPYFLRSVYELVVDGCRTDLVFNFGDSFLCVHADADDMLCVHHVNEEFDPQSSQHTGGTIFLLVTAEEPWTRWINTECCWTWSAYNQQGYFDSFMLSFDGIVPNVLLHLIASSINVFDVVIVKK